MSFTFYLYTCSHVHRPGGEGRWEREDEEQMGMGLGVVAGCREYKIEHNIG